MGSSSSKRSKNSCDVKSTKNNDRPLKSENPDTLDRTTNDVDNNEATGKVVHERKDSKTFWISHLKFRRRSSGDLKRSSSEKKAVNRNLQSASSKQTDIRAKEINSKTVLNNVYVHVNSSSSFTEGGNLKGANVVNGQSAAEELGMIGEDAIPGDLGIKHSIVTNAILPKPKHLSLSVTELYNILNDGALSPCISDPSYILLLDCRSKQEYEESHIMLAKPASSLYDNLQSYNLYGFSTNNDISSTVNEVTWLIVYGDPIDLEGDVEERSEIKVMHDLEYNHGAEPYLISSGFSHFRDLFPFMCNNIQSLNLKTVQVYPSMILDHQLYQGRGDQATNSKVVNDLNITHIVNITQDHVSAFPEKVQYLTIKLDDVSHSQLLKHFEKTTGFITAAFQSNGRVLVHCNLGVSRSSSVSIAYLIESRGWTLKTAHDFIKERRTCIRPNRGFLQQLAKWEEQTLGKKYTDPDDIWF